MGEHEVSTQQRYPWRAALRTAVQVLVALPAGLLVLATVLDIVAQDAVASYLPGPWVAWLVAASGVCAAVAGALSRVMAVPAVDAWLRRVGLASTPDRQ